eukprot:scaffold3846_cov108-Amphora_coffeaeformis.AAC.8
MMLLSTRVFVFALTSCWCHANDNNTFTLLENVPNPGDRAVQNAWQAATAGVCLTTQGLDPRTPQAANLAPNTTQITLVEPVSEGFALACGNCKATTAEWEDDARYFVLQPNTTNDYLTFRFAYGTRVFLADVWVNGGTAVQVACDDKTVGAMTPALFDGFYQYDNAWGFVATDPCYEITLRADSYVATKPGYGNKQAEIFLLQATFACQHASPSSSDGQPQTGGDPHFLRWTRSRRDSFHGECDLVLLHQATQDDMEIDIHIRTTIRNVYSFVQAAAIRVGSNVLEFQTNSGSSSSTTSSTDTPPLVYVNGQTIQHFPWPPLSNPEPANTIVTQIHPLFHNKPGRYIYVVPLKNNATTRVIVKVTKHFITVSLDGATTGLEQAVGMWGEFGTGNLVTRNGTVLAEDGAFDAFGMEWQVRPDVDPVLFSTPRAPQYPTACRMPVQDAKTKVRRMLRSDTIASARFVKQATEACERYQHNHFDLCLQDVLLTGDLDMADAW